MRISDWSSDVCSSDLIAFRISHHRRAARRIHVEEFIPLQPRGLAHQIIADPLFAEQEPDLARKGTERKLIELPHAHLCSARVAIRSEERRVGKEGVSTCRSRG